MTTRRIVNLVTVMEAAGAQGAAVRLTESLRERGHDAETWFMYVKRPAYADTPNVRVIYPHRPHARDIPSLILRLVRMLREHRPDCVYAFTHHSTSIGLLAASLAGVRCRIATIRRPFGEFPASAKVLNGVLGTIGVFSSVIAVSHVTADSCSSLPRAFRRRIVTVPNGVAILPSSMSAAMARQRYGIPQNVKVMLTAGRLSPEKNHSVLVKALVHLPDIHLVVAGEGDTRRELNALATRLEVAGRLHLIGEIAPVEVASFLAIDGVFVFPSRFEAFGFAVVEAMAAGMPIVASDIPAMREVLGDNDEASAGIRVSPNDPAVWAAAVRRLLANDTETEAFRSRARSRATQFSLDQMVSGYEGVMEATL